MRSLQLVAMSSFFALGACGFDPSLAIPEPDPGRAAAVVRIPDRGAVEHGDRGALIEVAAIEFGVVDASGSATATAAVTNVSGRSIEMGAMTVSSAKFAVVETDCGAALAPGAACEVAVTFTPGAIGDVAATLALVAGGEETAVPMHGAGGGWIRVAKDGAGRGIVDSDAGDIACGDACDALFATPTVLRVLPVIGSKFGGWSGPCVAEGTGGCELEPSMTPIDVTATFTR